MKLSECNMGIIVCSDCFGTFNVGHIVGLAYNVQEKPEVIPVVKWAGATNPEPIHYNHLRRYED